MWGKIKRQKFHEENVPDTQNTKDNFIFEHSLFQAQESYFGLTLPANGTIWSHSNLKTLENGLIETVVVDDPNMSCVFLF